MKKWLHIFVILVIIGIVSIFFLWKMMVSPQYSLKQIKKAIPQHNVTAFDEYVDLDEVVDNVIVHTWQYYTAKEKTGSRWSEISNEISNSLISAVKPNLKEIVKKEILAYVATGQWASTDADDNNEISTVIIKMIKRRIDPEQWDYQSINFTKIEGETASIGLTYYDQVKETNFLVELKMKDMKGYWQLVEITNVAQLINMFQELNNN
jgi:hypothetical protein